MKRIDWSLELLDQLPKSKEEAIEKGFNKFFTGIMCERGHMSPRLLCGRCALCKREDTARTAEKRRRRLGMQSKLPAAIPRHGQKNGNVISLGESRQTYNEDRHRNILVLKVRCECGKEWWIRADYFGKIKSCRSCAQKRIATKHGYTRASKYRSDGPSLEYTYQLYHSAKKRAAVKGIEFTLELEDVPQPIDCPVFGFGLDWSSRKESGNKRPRYNAPSLDRLDPCLGYTKNNTVVISYMANVMKNNGSASEHELVAIWLERQLSGGGDAGTD